MARPTDQELENRIVYSTDGGADYGARPGDMNEVTHVQVYCKRIGGWVTAKVAEAPKAPAKRGRKVSTAKLQDQPITGGLKA